MKHLTDAQFSECLTAVGPEPAIQTHLAECDVCRMELGTFMAAMDDFGTAAMDWSKAQPVPSVRARSSKAQPGFATPMRWALAAAAIAAVGVPVVVQHERGVDAHLVADLAAGRLASANVPPDSVAQIAQDNQLLESVNVALAESDPSPLAEYGLDSKTRVKTQTRGE